VSDPLEIVNRSFYDSGAWYETRWLGVQTLKVPTDLWIYQELIAEIRPDLILESGTYRGGSALFLANVCELLGHGCVATIDLIEYPDRPLHPRITYLTGSSTDPDTAARARAVAPDASRCLVILDSDHSCAHVLAEMELYAPMVSEGSYLVVEDTNVNGHPVLPDFGPGPMEAVDAFLAVHDEFEIDVAREKFGITFNPRGYLRRKTSD
jgi:cephalosporin hydroxylase